MEVLDVLVVDVVDLFEEGRVQFLVEDLVLRLVLEWEISSRMELSMLVVSECLVMSMPGDRTRVR